MAKPNARKGSYGRALSGEKLIFAKPGSEGKEELWWKENLVFKVFAETSACENAPSRSEHTKGQLHMATCCMAAYDQFCDRNQWLKPSFEIVCVKMKQILSDFSEHT